jgi:hypothetical protein
MPLLVESKRVELNKGRKGFLIDKVNLNTRRVAVFGESGGSIFFYTVEQRSEGKPETCNL